MEFFEAGSRSRRLKGVPMPMELDSDCVCEDCKLTYFQSEVPPFHFGTLSIKIESAYCTPKAIVVVPQGGSHCIETTRVHTFFGNVWPKRFEIICISVHHALELQKGFLETEQNVSFLGNETCSCSQHVADEVPERVPRVLEALFPEKPGKGPSRAGVKTSSIRLA